MIIWHSNQSPSIVYSGTKQIIFSFGLGWSWAQLLRSVHHRLRPLTFPMRADNGGAAPVLPRHGRLLRQQGLCAVVQRGAAAQRGVIHKYVGDEIIATWPLAAGLRDGAVVRACFDALEQLDERADAYIRDFGLRGKLPRRASLRARGHWRTRHHQDGNRVPRRHHEYSGALQQACRDIAMHFGVLPDVTRTWRATVRDQGRAHGLVAQETADTVRGHPRVRLRTPWRRGGGLPGGGFSSGQKTGGQASRSLAGAPPKRKKPLRGWHFSHRCRLRRVLQRPRRGGGAGHRPRLSLGQRLECRSPSISCLAPSSSSMRRS